MACGARSGLKHAQIYSCTCLLCRLNGLWSPFGIETALMMLMQEDLLTGLNGLWSPFGIKTSRNPIAIDRACRVKGLWSPFGIETNTYWYSPVRKSIGLNGLWSPFEGSN